MIGEDASTYAIDTVFPFPISGIDGTCQIWVELASPTRKSFVINGYGFLAGERVRVRSSDGHDVKELVETADDCGGFIVAIDHRPDGGTAELSATGERCHVTLDYAFGKKAKGPQ